MLGNLGKSWVGGIVAVAVIAVAGFLLWRSTGGGPPGLGAAGDVLYVCPKDGTRLLAPAKPPPPKCTKCGGDTVVARVFECHKGHIFVGFLERPPAPDTVKAADEYSRHMPLVLRPGKDTDWAPGRAPVCPVCGLGMKRPVLALDKLKLDDIKMGKLPAAAGGR